MQWASWEKHYNRITKRLGISPEDDHESTRILHHYFRDQLAQIQMQMKRLKKLCQSPTLVFGAGPSLRTDLRECLDSDLQLLCTFIAADGATSEFIRNQVYPSIIVTDLDGDMNDIEEASRKGSLLVIHAHGDNTERIIEWVPRLLQFDPIPTTQVEPMLPIENFGGFTDGDRAVFMAVECGCTMLALCGFDLGLVVGQTSKPEFATDVIASPRKGEKLEIAAELLQELKKNASWDKPVSFFNLTARTAIKLQGFATSSPRKFAKHLKNSLCKEQ